ncbi:sensor histidine kinase [Sphingomonas desiccabilis]|uniref:sensor histidine kinase n=1 Tax=Sphingomonas desiccabilis TaxID=429134 RepID=UPI0017DA9316|nr:ATP-binding protein [Sphingomonas desiccabilis]MBB3912723.1 signal transduction histidine kinase [Sphingomonas desiccabilis]
MRDAGRGALPQSADLLWIAGYAAAFILTHRFAAAWGGQGFYSLLYPPAGVRMALLWSRGPRLTLAIVVAEMAVQTATGWIVPGEPGWITNAIGVARPPLVYGAVVWLVCRIAAHASSSLSIAPMPLGLASVTAPVAVAVVALPWALLKPELTGVVGLRQTYASLAGYTVGDLLGVLLLTPPLLWVIQAAREGPRRVFWPETRLFFVIGEAVLVLGGAIAFGLLLVRIDLGVPSIPALLAVAWIGLRFGRTAGWCAIVIVAAIVLPWTTGNMPLAERLTLHMSLTSVVVVGYLAGSFADAQARARADLARRDRMLFQAERLKTLRAMSVAVIHEIGQPLSTLALEAKHLHEITVGADREIAETAALINRKAASLSMLVHRLRRFGGRALDEPSALPVSSLIETVAALVRPEAKGRRVLLEIAPVASNLIVLGQEIELVQAIVNIVRNAIQAADGCVQIDAEGQGDRVEVTVTNRCPGHQAPQPGMGVGSLVARAILEAHEGTLIRETDAAGMVRATLSLPLVGAAG